MTTLMPQGGEAELRARLSEICEKVSGAVNRGIEYVVLSDRDSNAQWAPIPSLLLLSAVHHHLLKSANRTKISLLVEAGDVREVHHVAVLMGYGASAAGVRHHRLGCAAAGLRCLHGRLDRRSD